MACAAGAALVAPARACHAALAPKPQTVPGLHAATAQHDKAPLPDFCISAATPPRAAHRQSLLTQAWASGPLAGQLGTPSRQSEKRQSPPACHSRPRTPCRNNAERRLRAEIKRGIRRRGGSANGSLAPALASSSRPADPFLIAFRPGPRVTCESDSTPPRPVRLPLPASHPANLRAIPGTAKGHG